MLSRAADSLFWLARYMERMDNVARLLEAAQSMSGMTEGVEEWVSALVATGCDESYEEKHGAVMREKATHYLAADLENPSSLLSCLEAARTNARAMRTALTSDMWDAVNGSWLEARRLSGPAFTPERIGETIDWVKSVGTRFYGAYAGTMLRNEVYWFTRLGTFIERADNTARILDVKYHLLLPRDEGVGGAQDYYQWTSILRAVSAVRAYQWVYRTEVKPWNIAELLILRPEMPRSLRACYDEIDSALNQIAASHTGRRGECHRLAGEIAAQLRYGRVEDIFRIGLHEYLTDMIERTAKVGDEVRGFYMR
ncbi:MAG: alpha-E domain-containing protein [Alphaproteobacteria bacterium]|nr:alpha-E domain-containing protein [Alphaproteobacteria bacterium]